jgi:hypothetical protein
MRIAERAGQPGDFSWPDFPVNRFIGFVFIFTGYLWHELYRARACRGSSVSSLSRNNFPHDQADEQARTLPGCPAAGHLREVNPIQDTSHRYPGKNIDTYIFPGA